MELRPYGQVVPTFSEPEQRPDDCEGAVGLDRRTGCDVIEKCPLIPAVQVGSLQKWNAGDERSVRIARRAPPASGRRQSEFADQWSHLASISCRTYQEHNNNNNSSSSSSSSSSSYKNRRGSKAIDLTE